MDVAVQALAEPDAHVAYTSALRIPNGNNHPQCRPWRGGSTASRLYLQRRHLMLSRGLLQRGDARGCRLLVDPPRVYPTANHIPHLAHSLLLCSLARGHHRHLSPPTRLHHAWTAWWAGWDARYSALERDADGVESRVVCVNHATVGCTHPSSLQNRTEQDVHRKLNTYIHTASSLYNNPACMRCSRLSTDTNACTNVQHSPFVRTCVHPSRGTRPESLVYVSTFSETCLTVWCGCLKC